jgi:hypothetical protein
MLKHITLEKSHFRRIISQNSRNVRRKRYWAVITRILKQIEFELIESYYKVLQAAE